MSRVISQGRNKQEKGMNKFYKDHGLSLTVPVMLDIMSTDAYLLDGIDIRIRHELAGKSWVISTHKVDAEYR